MPRVLDARRAGARRLLPAAPVRRRRASRSRAGELEAGARPREPRRPRDRAAARSTRATATCAAAGVTPRVVRRRCGVRGRTTGWLTSRRDLRARYGGDDLRFLRVFAGRLAVALDNARLRARRAPARGADRRHGGRRHRARRRRADRARQPRRRSAAGRRIARASCARRASPSCGSASRSTTPDGRPLRRRRADLDAARSRARAARRRCCCAASTARTGEQRWLLVEGVGAARRGRPRRARHERHRGRDGAQARGARPAAARRGRAAAERDDRPRARRCSRSPSSRSPTLADWCGIDLPGPGGFDRSWPRSPTSIPAKVALAHAAARAPAGARRRRGVARDACSARARRVRIDDDAADAARGRRRRRAAASCSRRSASRRCWSSRCAPATTCWACSRSSPRRPHRRFDDADQEVAEALARPDRRRAAQRAAAARPRRDRARAVGRPAARRVAGHARAARSPPSTARPARTSRPAATSTT